MTINKKAYDMTRKNRTPIIVTKIKESVQSVQSVGIKTEDDLPPYVAYIDGLNKKAEPYRFFLEAPTDYALADPLIFPTYTFIGAGKFSRSGNHKPVSYLYTQGRQLVCEHLAKSFACLLIKKVTDQSQNGSSVLGTSNYLLEFLEYLSTLPQKIQPQSLSSITQFNFSGWLSGKSYKNVSKIKNTINATLKLSKYYTEWKVSSIRINNTKIIKNTVGDAPLNVSSMDDLMEGEDYSDAELMQILAYCFYQIQVCMDGYKKTMEMTKKSLGKTYIPLDSMNVSNKTLIGYMYDENEGHEIIRNNLYHHFRSSMLGRKTYNKKHSDSSLFLLQLTQLSKSVTVKSELPKIKSIKDFIFKDMLAQSYNFVKSNKSEVRKELCHYFHSGISMHPEWAISVYIMISAGINMEVLNSLKWSIDGKPWYKNFDIQLGLDKDTPKKDAQIVLVGEKRKGQSFKNKKVYVPVKVNSPLYNYLKYLDKIRVQPREFIFNFCQFTKNSQAFCSHFEIYSDNKERITSIQTMKFRKVFAGHKLIQMLDNVKSPDELVSKLKKALNHSNFDTTFFSYLLKSGSANLVLNTAIVALTSSLLEKAIAFKGTIKINLDERDITNAVYLCDCSDPKKPTHGLPIAGRCKKYDMCLGCERSEVYSEHIPRIFYRIFQYEALRAYNPNDFRAMSEDRLIIATKTINVFRQEHPEGEKLLNEAYDTANHAYSNGIHLVPPILQFR
jgi:hypothetical protein